MCNERSSVEIELASENIIGLPLNEYEYPQMIDACMVEVIKKLRENGTMTIACCCGHGKYPRTVIYRAMGGNAIEYYTSTILLNKDGSPKKRNFYKLDSEGFYYLPKVSDPVGE